MFISEVMNLAINYTGKIERNSISSLFTAHNSFFLMIKPIIGDEFKL